MTVALAPRARRQLEALLQHYAALGRDQAVANLRAAVLDAEVCIERGDGRVLPAPRSYPELSGLGLSWLHIGRYWIAFRTVPRTAIHAVLWDSADIPRRLRDD